MKRLIFAFAAALAVVSGCQKASPNIGQVSKALAPNQVLVANFFGARDGEQFVFTATTIERDHYWVIMDHDRRKAVVLSLADSWDNAVTARGFFTKSHTNEWLRDTREVFEMGGGVWTLDRFLQVLDTSQRDGSFEAFTWPPKA